MAMTTTTTTTTTTTIFDLPLFIREQIYDCIFDSAPVSLCVWRRYDFQYILEDQEDKDRPVTFFAKNVLCMTLAIAQTCRFVRAEALPRFYKTADIGLDGRDHDEIRNYMQAFIQLLRDWHLEHGDDERQRAKDGENMVDEQGQFNCSREKCIDDSLRAHLKTVSRVVRHLRYLAIDHWDLPHIGWDVDSWAWTPFLWEKLPKLDWLRVRFDVCLCDGTTTLLVGDLARESGVRRDDRRSSAIVSDGEFVYRLWRSTPHWIGLTFEIVFSQCDICGWGKETMTVTINPDQRLHLGETDGWLKHHSTQPALSRMIANFMRDFGLEYHADEMMRRIGDADRVDVNAEVTIQVAPSPSIVVIDSNE